MAMWRTEMTVFYMDPPPKKKIERSWRELSHRMEGYFKDQLKSLLEDGDYDPSNETDRYALQTKMHLITCTQGLGGLGGC